jgi:hypothetical protein
MRRPSIIRRGSLSSGRGIHTIHLPDGVRPVPVLFQQAGYSTCVGDGLAYDDARADRKKQQRLGKTDYNFEWDPKMYDGEDWAGRADGQPFFMQVMLPGGTIRRNRRRARRHARDLHDRPRHQPRAGQAVSL